MSFLSSSLAPTATVLPFAAASAPSGWLLCDGSAVSRTTYASLFAVMGTSHGSGDGSTTFNLPDYRGRFLRGTANGQTTDPDRTSRTAMAAGGNTGDAVGSVQGDNFASHSHVSASTSFMAQSGGSWATPAATGSNNINGVNNTGGNETRPKNANVNYIIKI